MSEVFGDYGVQLMTERWSKPMSVNHATPMKVLREFVRGKWTETIATEYDIPETQVQALLMDATRKILKQWDGEQ